jgi:hypothetical protein
MQVEILLMVIWLLAIAIATQLLWKFLVDALFIRMTNFLNHPIKSEEDDILKTLANVEDQVIGLNDEV